MKWFKRLLLALAVLLLVAQAYRPARTNPPVEPKNTIQASMAVPPAVDAILERSCNDCHSNRTAWPWYSNVAPASWLLVDHVREGRQELNFSEFATYSARRKGRKFAEICEQVKEGEMPIEQYVILHPESKLSDADRQTLCKWAEPFATKRAPRPAS